MTECCFEQALISRKPVFIYGLSDPRDGLIYYIGKTEDTAQRLRGHLSDARYKNGEKAEWLRGLMAIGLRPEIVILETVPVGEWWIEAECRHIAEHKANGGKLFNRTNGGEGVPDTKRTEEWKRKIVEARKANVEWQARFKEICAKRRGTKLSDETKAKISAAHKGRKQRPEVVEARAARQRGRKAHPNLIAGARAFHLGSKASEEAKEKKRASMAKYRDVYSERQRQNWLDPEYRARVVPNMCGHMPGKETRQKLSESSKRAWADPVKRAARMQTLDAVYKSAEWREKRANIAKGLWADSEFRERMLMARADARRARELNM